MKIFFPFILLIMVVSCTFSPQRTPEEEAMLRQQLIHAIRTGDKILFDSCLMVGTDPNARDEEGTPAIIHAANVGSLTLVRQLIEKGADVDAKRTDYYYSTALMEIAARGDTALARVLLDAGADVTQRDTFGDPAINWAAYYGQLPFVDILMEYGATWETMSQHGNALEIAMKQWHDPLVDFFIKKGAGQPLSAEAKQWIDALKSDQLDRMKKLHMTGLDINQSDAVGSPSLVLAASRGNREMVQFLLEKGAAPNMLNAVGQSALSRAAYFGHVRICEDLIKAGADVNLAGDRYHLTPLISAANSGQSRVGKLLIQNGAELNDQDAISGFTPLMYATAYGQEDFVALLLDAGANPYVRSADGASLFDMLSLSRNSRIQELLEDYMQEQQ